MQPRDSLPHSGGSGTGGSGHRAIGFHRVIDSITSIGFYLSVSNDAITLTNVHCQVTIELSNQETRTIEAHLIRLTLERGIENGYI